jgi:hypothetical protein
MPSPTAQPIQYTVEIQSVRELNLVGQADLAYWTAHLAGTGLTPLNRHGHAELTLGATDLTWMGVRFNESILTLTLANPAAPQAEAGAYLVHAYNSKRSLAFMERAFFKTPYYPAAIQLADQYPARFTVTDPAGGLLQAATAAADRPRQATNVTWEGAVHLPKQRPAPQGHGGYFYVKLAGPGECYPFLPGDTFTLTPSRESPALQFLRDSHFTPLEWRHRPAATHGKSRTYSA